MALQNEISFKVSCSVSLAVRLRPYRISFQHLSRCVGHRFIILSSFAMDHFEFSSLPTVGETQLEHKKRVMQQF